MSLGLLFWRITYPVSYNIVYYMYFLYLVFIPKRGFPGKKEEKYNPSYCPRAKTTRGKGNTYGSDSSHGDKTGSMHKCLFLIVIL